MRIFVTLGSLRKPVGETRDHTPLVIGVTQVEGISLLASSYFARVPVYPGIHRVEVDAIDTEAQAFYRKFGFLSR